MNKFKKYFLIFTTINALASCGNNSGWSTSNHLDEFTGSKSCRVERTSKEYRDFLKGFSGRYFTYHFFAENHDGEIRAGIMSEPAIPISGDVQIKVGEKLVTLTPEDAPIDLAPSNQDYSYSAETTKKLGYDLSDTMSKITKNIQQSQSPYRVLTGDKAISLLRDMANTKDEIKFRVIGVNSALSEKGIISTDDNFINALNRCGISI